LDENDDAQGGGDDDDGHDEEGGKMEEYDDNSRTDEAEASPRQMLQLVGCNHVRIVVGAAYIKHFTCDMCPASPAPVLLWRRSGCGRVPWAIVELEPESEAQSGAGFWRWRVNVSVGFWVQVPGSYLPAISCSLARSKG